MIKFNDNKIGFNSTLEHRLVEKVRLRLKKEGYTNIKTISHDEFNWIMEGYKNQEKIKIYILMRTVGTSNASMNRESYEKEILIGGNPLLILTDREHMYPLKFLLFKNINNRSYRNASTPFVLFPEVDFKEELIKSEVKC